MADTGIFSQGPPEWLQRRAQFDLEQNTESLNNLAGMAGSAISAGVQTGTKGGNFLDNWKSAYMDLKDPYWEGKKATADLQVATMKDRVQGMKEYPEWMQSTGGSADKMLDTPFVGKSQWAADMVEKAKMSAWQRSTQQQAVEVKQQQVENQLTIQGLKNQMDADKIDTAKQIAAMQAASREKVADTTANSREKVADINANAKVDLASTAQQYKLDLEKYKSDLKQTQGGKSVSKQEFINRQMGRLMGDLYNSWDTKKDGDYDAQKAANKAVEILGQTYDQFSKQPASQPSASVKLAGGQKPTASDVSYLAEHPEMKDKFESKFGSGSADQYLP